MRIRCVGCAGGYPMGENGTTSYLLSDGANEYHVLIDAGSGSAIHLEKYLDVSQLDAIIVSHDHPDHVADLGVFQHLFMLKSPRPKVKPVPIYTHWHSIVGEQLAVMDTSENVSYRPDEIVELGPFDVSFCLTVHPLECYAMRFVERDTGKVFVYTADTAWVDRLVPFASDADVLIADASFTNDFRKNELHLLASEVAKLANDAKVKKVIASHIAPQADAQAIMTEIAQDLDKTIELEQAYPGMLINI